MEHRQGGLGERREHRTRHRRGEQRRHHEAAKTDRQLREDERREDAIPLLLHQRCERGIKRIELVKSPQREPDRQEQHHHELARIAPVQRQARLAHRAAAQHALRVELIRAIGGEVLERHREHTRPERELQLRVEAEIKYAGLASCSARLEQAPKPPRMHLRHIEHRHHATRDQHHELQHVGPDHCPYTPEPCAHHRGTDRERDAPSETEAGQQLEHQRDRVDAHALPQHRTQEEQQRGDPAEHGAETVADVVVGARVILFVEARHDEMADYPLRDHAGERELQVAIVAALREHQRRHADEGHAADRGRDDGSRDGRPRQAA